MRESYDEMKARHQKEYNEFSKNCVFFAYSKEQFEKGMESLGLKPNEINKIFRFSDGAFILRTKSKEQNKLFKKFLDEQKQAIDNDKDGAGFIADMFLSELNNHECAYTGDLNSALEDLDLTIEEVRTNPKLLNGMKIALKDIFGDRLRELGYVDD